MDFRGYCIAVIVLILLLGGGFAAVNLTANDFGLWRSRDTARIWALEKTSKYLLAYRYIPENFDGVLIGPSVSANIDTRRLPEARLYNLSMMGGNITEAAAALNAYLENEKNPKTLIVCLYPYLTKDSGIKGFQIDSKEYYGSLFSVIPAAVWLRKTQIFLSLKNDILKESESGWNPFEKAGGGRDMAAFAAEKKKALDKIRAGDTKAAREYAIIIDPQARAELDVVLQKARARGMTITAFYYPVFAPVMDIWREIGDWQRYRDSMNALFAGDDTVIDMNEPGHGDIGADPAHYFDGAHLSTEGAEALASQLAHTLKYPR